MYRLIKTFLVLLLLWSFSSSTMAYTTQFADASENQPLRWKSGTIPIALSTSLTNPSLNIKSNSDVLGAVKRSLETWEKAAAIKFEITTSDKQSVSPAGKTGDGVSLITIAQTPENALLFGGESEDISARTRVFYNSKGFVTEADIVLNPYQQFSTDGSFGNFDLESTLTHEIGHLLGLEHSQIAGSTMYAHQGQNGLYNISLLSSRTLSSDDIAGIRALYGVGDKDENCCGTISGKLLQTNVKKIKNFEIWAEEAETGRIAAGVQTNSDGSFRIDGLSVGDYRVYAKEIAEGKASSSDEALGSFSVTKGKITTVTKKLNLKEKDFDVQYIGFEGQISDLAVPLNSGKSYRIYVGGKNLNPDDLKINFNSPFLSVRPDSVFKHNYGDDISVFSFEVEVKTGTPLGEYSFSIQNKDQETAYFIGGLTVENFENPSNISLLFNGE